MDPLDFRQLAEDAVRNGMPEPGPDHPDAQLLELCELVLNLKHRFDLLKLPRPMPLRAANSWADLLERSAAVHDVLCRTKTAMQAAGHLPAQTLAGLFAKAMMCTASRSGAPALTRSMAHDVLALRAAIWAASPPLAEK